MLEINIPGEEYFNDNTGMFEYGNDTLLQLEHSLIAISKWEMKWHKSFISNTKNNVEILDYIKCMTLNDVDDTVYKRLTIENITDIKKYIDDPMTAIIFPENNNNKGTRNRDTITNELIYYWMISFNIPVEFQHWHINRLLTLIKIFDIKNSPSKKMSKQEIMSRNRALNEARRKANNSKG